MGLFKDIINGTKQLYKLKEGEYKGDVEQMYEASGELMRLIHKQHFPDYYNDQASFKELGTLPFGYGRETEPIGGTPQATYLMPRKAQRQKFLETGYIDGSPGDYGLVKKAVGKRNLPVFQTAPDSITRDELIPIGNTGINKNKYFSERYFPIGIEKELFNAANYPSTIYIDANGGLYRKSWDLNDYGNSSAGDGGYVYKGLHKLGANLLDVVGSPVVVTTGFQPVLKPVEDNISTIPIYNGQETIYTQYDLPLVHNWLNSNGRINIPIRDEKGNIIAFSNILPQFEPVITAPSLH